MTVFLRLVCLRKPSLPGKTSHTHPPGDRLHSHQLRVGPQNSKDGVLALRVVVNAVKPARLALALRTSRLLLQGTRRACCRWCARSLACFDAPRVGLNWVGPAAGATLRVRFLQQWSEQLALPMGEDLHREPMSLGIFQSVYGPRCRGRQTPDERSVLSCQRLRAIRKPRFQILVCNSNSVVAFAFKGLGENTRGRERTAGFVHLDGFSLLVLHTPR